jgi:hypothetical protein
LIARLLQEDEKRREEQRAHGSIFSGPLFDSAFARRCLRLMNSIFLALVNCG